MSLASGRCITPALLDGQHTSRLCVEAHDEAHIFVAYQLVWKCLQTVILSFTSVNRMFYETKLAI
jgi:hypothetical protein